MKYPFVRHIVATFCLLALNVVNTLAAPAKLALQPSGVQIDTGDLGKFTLGAPILKNAEGADVPLVARAEKDARTAIYRFFDDTIVEVAVDKDAPRVTVSYPQHSANAKTIVFRAIVPFELRQGGTASFDGQDVPFPLDLKAGPNGHQIWSGEAARFAMQSARGQIVAIDAPRNWQQLQDNRFWNGNASFEWIYFYELNRDPNTTRFSFEIKELAAGTPAPVAPVQVADKFGQSKLVDFPNKIQGETELKADIEKDNAYYASFNPPARDVYGGLPGSGARFGLKKTGFFHVETINDATRGELPTLVDPDGNLWFQLGLCSMGNLGDSPTLLSGRREKFEWLPPVDSEFASAFIDGGASFSFYAANWTRKFGQPWDREIYQAQTIKRVRQLGFNSAGAFSNPTQSGSQANWPRVEFVSFDGMETIPETRGIIDPFADGATAKLDAAFANLAVQNDDPLVIGHFLGNEQAFENIPKIVPTLDAKSGAKRRLVEMLRGQYGDINQWNNAWQPKTLAVSFDELDDAKLYFVTKAAADDMSRFYGVLLERYYQMIATAYQKVCPNHLLLGNRWLSSSANDDQTVEIAGKYLDVVSINYYSYGIESDFLRRIHKLSGGRPLLLSEWHYGADDQGLSGGARQVKNQRERGLAYRNYVEAAAALGFVVGQQWFSYLDQATTGRWFEGDNGERGNIGLVNVADRPYREFLSHVTQTNFAIYDVLLGKKAPFRYDDPRFLGAVGGQKVVSVPRALPGMTINGVVDNWPGLPAERVSRLAVGTESENVQPVSGDFRLAWDAKNLYLFIQVKDATPMQNETTGADIWQGDSVEIFVGPENLDEGGALQFGDRQVLLSARKGEDGYRWYFNNASAQFPIQMSVVLEAGGYAIEAAIPFEGLGFGPREGQEISFDIGLNDATAGRRQYIWNGGPRNSGDRSAWGRAKLVN